MVYKHTAKSIHKLIDKNNYTEKKDKGTVPCRSDKGPVPLYLSGYKKLFV